MEAGWAVTSQADLLIYYVPGAWVIYVMPLAVLRAHLPRWSQQYPTRPAQGRKALCGQLLIRPENKINP